MYACVRAIYIMYSQRAAMCWWRRICGKEKRKK